MVLYQKLDITDLSATKRTLGSENRGTTLSRLYGEADTVTLTVRDPARTFADFYEPGSKVELYADSTDPPTTKVFRGIVESVRESFGGNQRFLEITASELFYIILLNRIVFEDYRNLLVGDVVKDLLLDHSAGFNTANVADTDYTIEQITFAGLALLDCFDNLADLSFHQYFCDPLLNVFLYPQNTRVSSLSLVAADVHRPQVITRTIMPMKTETIVLGAQQISLDQEQATITGSVDLDALYIAVAFDPTATQLKKIAVNIQKIGSPPSLLGEIVEDASGLPASEEIGTFSFKGAGIAAQGWYEAGVEAELDTDKTYWLILYRTGDASNTYRWFHDNSSANAHADSTTGLTYTNRTSTWKPSFRTYFGTPALAKSRNTVIADRYDFDGSGLGLQGLYMNTNITDRLVAKRLAMKLNDDLARLGSILPDINMINPTTVPQPGELVALNLGGISFNESLFLNKVDITWPPGQDFTDFMLMGFANNKRVI